jgi:hypothetical protein
MRRAAVALRSWLAVAVGVEGAFFLAGTALVAYGASFVSPAGAPLAIGAAFLLAWLALAVPRSDT